MVDTKEPRAKVIAYCTQNKLSCFKCIRKNHPWSLSGLFVMLVPIYIPVTSVGLLKSLGFLGNSLTIPKVGIMSNVAVVP